MSALDEFLEKTKDYLLQVHNRLQNVHSECGSTKKILKKQGVIACQPTRPGWSQRTISSLKQFIIERKHYSLTM